MKHCLQCKNYGTVNCPNSDKCYVTVDKPFFEPKKKDNPIPWKYICKKLWHCILVWALLFIVAAILEYLLGVPRINTYTLYIGVLLSIAYDSFIQDKQ